MVGGQPGPWGPLMHGGHRWRGLRRALKAVGIVGLLGLVAAVSTGFQLYQQMERNLTRMPLDQLDEATEPTDARHFLVVGSDSRGDLDDAARREMSLGDFEGQRSDTIIYVAISADRDQVSLVSFPRDLLVIDDGRQRKLTDTFAGGAEDLIRVIQDNFGLPVNHFADVSLGGFIDAVDTLDGVEICLDEPLRDPKSGADFTAGCHDMGAEDALAYVRSRAGHRADFQRIDRQQTFLRSVLAELTERRVLTNVPRLFQLVEDLSSNLTTDERLGVAQLRGLAEELRDVVRDGVPMTAVPAYTRTYDGADYVIAYEPGARAMFEALRAGRPLPARGTAEQREDVTVGLWSGGRSIGAAIVAETLRYAAFEVDGAGYGPAGTDAGETTTVHRLPGHEQEADWVAAMLGAPVEDLPLGVEAPASVDVMVAVGDDAAGS